MRILDIFLAKSLPNRPPRWQSSAHIQLFLLFCKCLLLARAFIVATLPALVLHTLLLLNPWPAPHFTSSTTPLLTRPGMHILLQVYSFHKRYISSEIFKFVVDKWKESAKAESPHHHIKREGVLWGVAVFLCMEGALCRRHSPLLHYFCSHSHLLIRNYLCSYS